MAVAGCGSSLSAAPISPGGGAPTGSAAATRSSAAVSSTTTTRTRPVHVSLSPHVTPLASTAPSAWTPVAKVAGATVAWEAQRGGVTLLRFDQHHAELHLHAGSIYPGGTGWPYGDQIQPNEIHRIIAGFNGGFKFNVPGNGFEAGGHTAVALSPGLGSVVTYTDGTTAIGAWHEGVPRHGLAVESVRQNLQLLVDRSKVNPSAFNCPLSCWGATIGGRIVTARSGLGITPSGQLVWGAGEAITAGTLGQAFVDAGVVRAVELDINPAWVAGYLYVHHSTGPKFYPVVPGQAGIAGQLLLPYNRDFFTVVSR